MQMLQEPVYRRTTATDIARIDYPAFAQAVGLTFNPVASNADVVSGIQRALATPGPVLTQVTVRYEGREMRWLNALRAQYLKKLPNSQKVRLAARIGVRTISRQPDSD
jgi:acetolactate synthase-1/2/3 large subunit